ncbi:cytochrome c class I [Methylopila sp. Yamaguchi]|nr:cytochrome c class I [Methylopila sp. Yamaguchi]
MRFFAADRLGGAAAALAIAAALAAAAGFAVMKASDAAKRERVAVAVTGGDPARAPALLRRYGCGGCHTIPGVPGADGQAAAPLAGLAARVYVGGVAPNTAENLIRWIVAPQSLSPGTAMPATGISESEARDVAAYLYAN